MGTVPGSVIFSNITSYACLVADTTLSLSVAARSRFSFHAIDCSRSTFTASAVVTTELAGLSAMRLLGCFRWNRSYRFLSYGRWGLSQTAGRRRLGRQKQPAPHLLAHSRCRCPGCCWRQLPPYGYGDRTATDRQKQVRLLSDHRLVMWYRQWFHAACGRDEPCHQQRAMIRHHLPTVFFGFRRRRRGLGASHQRRSDSAADITA